MRINEYRSLEEFTAQYTGEWSPSDGHWFGLEFRYKEHEYRLQPGSCMMAIQSAILRDGKSSLDCTR